MTKGCGLSALSTWDNFSLWLHCLILKSCSPQNPPGNSFKTQNSFGSNLKKKKSSGSLLIMIKLCWAGKLDALELLEELLSFKSSKFDKHKCGGLCALMSLCSSWFIYDIYTYIYIYRQPCRFCVLCDVFHRHQSPGLDSLPVMPNCIKCSQRDRLPQGSCLHLIV